ncbi:unnamed protein product [Mytilus edulis]|uniref:Uncharacterized protein n=1 Tax=Mytilus edulis TaxID=6550 RepID=A0A8S3SHD0_MYTED|nr:unnamed protein product [Mytilus edulis]
MEKIAVKRMVKIAVEQIVKKIAVERMEKIAVERMVKISCRTDGKKIAVEQIVRKIAVKRMEKIAVERMVGVRNIEYANDALDQQSRRDHIRVTGLPEVEGHEDVIDALARAMKVVLTGKIGDAYRTGKKTPGKNRQVIVKFENRTDRFKFLARFTSDLALQIMSNVISESLRTDATSTTFTVVPDRNIEDMFQIVNDSDIIDFMLFSDSQINSLSHDITSTNSSQVATCE